MNDNSKILILSIAWKWKTPLKSIETMPDLFFLSKFDNCPDENTTSQVDNYWCSPPQMAVIILLHRKTWQNQVKDLYHAIIAFQASTKQMFVKGINNNSKIWIWSKNRDYQGDNTIVSLVLRQNRCCQGRQ
jgi:hypothetical protein